MGHFEKKKIYNTKRPIINRYIATSISVYCISSYGPASHLLPPLENTSHYLCMVFVNATFVAQLTVCLPHAGRKVTECLNRQYPSCWTGRFRLDAWPAKPPDLRSLD